MNKSDYEQVVSQRANKDSSSLSFPSFMVCGVAILFACIFLMTAIRLGAMVNKISEERDRLDAEAGALSSKNCDLLWNMRVVTVQLEEARDENRRLKNALESEVVPARPQIHFTINQADLREVPAESQKNGSDQTPRELNRQVDGSGSVGERTDE